MCPRFNGVGCARENVFVHGSALVSDSRTSIDVRRTCKEDRGFYDFKLCWALPGRLWKKLEHLVVDAQLAFSVPRAYGVEVKLLLSE